MRPTPNPKDPNLPPPVQPIPFTLAPILFNALYPEQNKPEQPGYPILEMPLFPGSTVRQGLLIIPEEYILVEKDETHQLYNLGEGKTFILNINLTNGFGMVDHPQVQIIKNRRCANRGDKHGRTLLLIRSTVSLDPLSLLPDDTTLSLLSLTGENVGEIHPGQGDFRGKGSENSIGHGHENSIGHGHTNCYGSGIYDNVTSLTDIEQVVTADKLTPGNLSPDRCESIIAVLDTGIIFTEEAGEKHEGHSCRTTRSRWNFVTNDAFPIDDHQHHHGTRIATIIRKKSPFSSIAPIKVSNQDNVCTLYDILCGLEYSRSIGAKVINASWSFPASIETSIPILRAAIERFEGWLVCAAGNARQYFPDVDNPGNPLLLGVDDHYLYPACYSPDIDTVITVTTVISSQLPYICPCDIDGPVRWMPIRKVTENRSATFVDVGVVANAPLPGGIGNRGFYTPGFSPSDGSSFATPCIAGAVADYLSRHPFPITKRVLLQQIAPAIDMRQLGNDIRDGRYLPA